MILSQQKRYTEKKHMSGKSLYNPWIVTPVAIHKYRRKVVLIRESGGKRCFCTEADSLTNVLIIKYSRDQNFKWIEPHISKMLKLNHTTLLSILNIIINISIE